MTRDILIGIPVFIIYLINYFLWGILLTHIFKKNEESTFFIISCGFFLQGIIFFALVFPLKLLGTTLEFASSIWKVVWLISIIIIILVCRKDIVQVVKRDKKSIGWEHFIWGAITFIEIIYEGAFGRYTNGGGGIFYNSYVSTEVFTNTLDKYYGINGTLNTSHEYTKAYFLQTYLEHSAVVCKITGISPLMESRVVMSTIVILISSMSVFALGKTIFEKKSYALYFWFIFEVGVGIMAQCVYIPAYHLYYRTFEGKAIFGMILIPLVFLLFWRVYDNSSEHYNVVALVLVLLGSLTYCMGTMYVIPILLLGYFPICIVQKSKEQFKNWLLCWIPCILAMIFYVGCNIGIISL